MPDTGRVENISSPPAIKKVLYLFLRSSGLVLVILAAIVFFMGLLSLISGDGFTDAAPWWVFLFMVAAALGLPGIILILIARFVSKKIDSEKGQISN